MPEDDEHEHGPEYLNAIVFTPWGPMSQAQWAEKQQQIAANTEANTRAVQSLFETLSKDDLHALHCILVAIEDNPPLVHYFLGMSVLATRMRFGDDEITSIIKKEVEDDGSSE